MPGCFDLIHHMNTLSTAALNDMPYAILKSSNRLAAEECYNVTFDMIHMTHCLVAFCRLEIGPSCLWTGG
eukprot:scaffold17615_cov20-Prasinocladus_malaysianus.AAC.1